MREGNALHYTGQPMQSTVSEYRSSAFYGSVTCSVFTLHEHPGGHSISLDQVKMQWADLKGGSSP